MEPKLFLLFEEQDALIVQMGGYFNNLELQNNSLEALEILKAKNFRKMLINLTKLEVLMNISQVWTKEVWYPKALEYGLNYISFIIPMGFIAQEDLAKINKNSEERPVCFMFFESEKEGLVWLHSKA